MQMLQDALRRKSNATIKELEKENASYATVTQKATEEAATALSSLQDVLTQLRTTKTQLAQANVSQKRPINRPIQEQKRTTSTDIPQARPGQRLSPTRRDRAGSAGAAGAGGEAGVAGKLSKVRI
jgi:hypothetical protein